MQHILNIEQDEASFRLIELGVGLRGVVEAIKSAGSRFLLCAISWLLFKFIHYSIKKWLEREIEINLTNYHFFKEKQQILHKILEKNSQNVFDSPNVFPKKDWLLENLSHNHQILLKWVKLYSQKLDNNLEILDNQVNTRINNLVQANKEPINTENYRFSPITDLKQFEIQESAEELIKQLRK